MGTQERAGAGPLAGPSAVSSGPVYSGRLSLMKSSTRLRSVRAYKPVPVHFASPHDVTPTSVCAPVAAFVQNAKLEGRLQTLQALEHK